MLFPLFIIYHIFLTTTMQAEHLVSFIPGADDSQFPLENIPFGVASRKNCPNEKFAATRIGIN